MLPKKKSSLVSRWAKKYSSFLNRYAGMVALVTAVAAGFGLYNSARLYMDLRTDLEELLPENAQSVIDVKKVVGRVGGFNHLSIVIEAPNKEAGFRFQQDLVAELKKLPPTLVARVEDNIIKERAFFTKYKHLYMDLEDWRSLDEYVTARISHAKEEYEKIKRRSEARKKARKAGLSRAEASRLAKESHGSEPAPEYDFSALENKYQSKAKELDRFPDGYFRSENGLTHVVLAFLPGKVTDQKANQKLFDAAKGIVQALNPKKYDRQMVVGFNGDVSNMIEEHEGLIEDLESSTILVLLLVGTALYAYFRTFAGIYALGAALFAGTFWTFGLSYHLVGYLNANTAFLGSIVIGNGINFGIILLARYLEERRKLLPPEEALAQAVTHTLRATAVASSAAGIAYGSLVVTDFRGFNQFGVIGGLGMALCWLATFTIMPALLMLLERRGLIRVASLKGAGRATRMLAMVVTRYARGITLATLAVSLVSLALLTKFSADTLESDFSKLRNRSSIETGSGFWGRKVDQVFQRYLTPTVVVTDTAEQADRVAVELKRIMEREGALSPLSDVKQLKDLLPTEQESKIAHIKNIRSLLTPDVLSRLNQRERRRVDNIIPPRDEPVVPLTEDDLPEGIKVHFRELDGTTGNLVHVYPRLATGNFWDGREVIRFAEQVREAIRAAGLTSGEAAIAGQPPLSADMIKSISRDGPKATAWAFGLVALLVVLIFRDWRMIAAILSALWLGVLWMAAVMAWKDLKINFLNFIALPITFGIGVDYAVNVFSRYVADRKNGQGDLATALQETGGAVALCSLTTVIGYGSLLVAGSQAFVSFGVLSVLGEVTCIVAALVAVPAVMVWLDGRKTEKYKALFQWDMESAMAVFRGGASDSTKRSYWSHEGWREPTKDQQTQPYQHRADQHRADQHLADQPKEHS